jgi:hypothetical protein
MASGLSRRDLLRLVAAGSIATSVHAAGGPYELQTRSTLLFDVECRLAGDPRGGERRLFAQVPYMQRGTY